MANKPLLAQIKELLPESAQEKYTDEEIKFFSLVILLVTASLIFIFFLLMPMYRSIGSNREAAAEMSNEINIMQRNIARLDDVKRERDDLEQRWTTLNQNLPREGDVPDFIEELSDIANKFNLRIISINASSSRPTRVTGENEEVLYRSLPIRIDAKSGFHELGHFLSELESRDRIISTESLRISEERRIPGVHMIDLELRTYFGAG